MNGLAKTLFALAAYATAVGILVAILRTVWRRIWGIEVRPVESGLLVGAIMGFLAGFGFARGHWFAATSAGLIVIGYFIAKIVAHKFGK